MSHRFAFSKCGNIGNIKDELCATSRYQKHHSKKFVKSGAPRRATGTAEAWPS